MEDEVTAVKNSHQNEAIKPRLHHSPGLEFQVARAQSLPASPAAESGGSVQTPAFANPVVQMRLPLTKAATCKCAGGGLTL